MTVSSLQCGGLVFLVALSSARAEEARRFTLRYDVEVRDVPPTAQRVDVWLPVPPQTDYQRILSLNIETEARGEFTREHAYGNRMWHGRFDPPFDRTLKVSQRVEVERLAQTADAPSPSRSPSIPENSEMFLKPNALVPLSGRFRRIAEMQTREKIGRLAQARALYDYVLGKMTYDKSGRGWGRGDADFACDIGRGNCTDFHSLFIALSRSLHIPTRFWIGFPIPETRGKGSVGGYHCWAEFWVPGRGWVPVDISEADKHPEKAGYYFGHLDENRIAYSLGRDIILSPRQHSPPLNFFVYPHVEVDGKPWNRVDRRFSYEDVRRPPVQPGSQ